MRINFKEAGEVTNPFAVVGIMVTFRISKGERLFSIVAGVMFFLEEGSLVADGLAVCSGVVMMLAGGLKILFDMTARNSNIAMRDFRLDGSVYHD